VPNDLQSREGRRPKALDARHLVEMLVPAGIREFLVRLGHAVDEVGPHSSIFGWGQAVMHTPQGVNFGASEPRHHGGAISQGAPTSATAPERANA
jgi:hypothetical protein